MRGLTDTERRHDIERTDDDESNVGDYRQHDDRTECPCEDDDAGDDPDDHDADRPPAPGKQHTLARVMVSHVQSSSSPASAIDRACDSLSFCSTATGCSVTATVVAFAVTFDDLADMLDGVNHLHT
ncbi:MAG: hypothetical protein ACLPXZ_08160 [Mycobacterium sp.]